MCNFQFFDRLSIWDGSFSIVYGIMIKSMEIDSLLRYNLSSEAEAEALDCIINF